MATVQLMKTPGATMVRGYGRLCEKTGLSNRLRRVMPHCTITTEFDGFSLVLRAWGAFLSAAANPEPCWIYRVLGGIFRKKIDFFIGVGYQNNLICNNRPV